MLAGENRENERAHPKSVGVVLARPDRKSRQTHTLRHILVRNRAAQAVISLKMAGSPDQRCGWRVGAIDRQRPLQ